MANCENHIEHGARLDKIEKRIDTIDVRIDDLADQASRSDEKTKMIFKILDEIKAMLKEYTESMGGRIDRLSQDLEGIKMRPSRMYDGISIAVISAIAGAIAVWLISGR